MIDVSKFTPPLPPEKVKAFGMMGFDNGVKLIVIFKERVWGEDIQNCICSDSLIPEMWFRKCKETGLWVCTCFLTSKMGDDIVKLGLSKSTTACREQLFEMFAIDSSSSFVTSHLYIWDDIPSIQGGYTHPLPGLTENNRTTHPRFGEDCWGEYLLCWRGNTYWGMYACTFGDGNWGEGLWGGARFYG
jgi:hypothetical protein